MFIRVILGIKKLASKKEDGSNPRRPDFSGRITTGPLEESPSLEGIVPGRSIRYALISVSLWGLR